MHDSVSMWVYDQRGEVGLTRIGIEAIADHCESHGHQVNVAFSDGTVYRLRDDGKAWAPEGPDGTPSVLGAGPLSFRCVEPFRTWVMTFDGSAVQTSSFDLAAGRIDGPPADVRFEVGATMAARPWEQGTLRPEAGVLLQTTESDLMGGDRYEQLFRCTGSVQVAGGRSRPSPAAACASAARGPPPHRVPRPLLAIGAVSPSGKAFGYITYPPYEDGRPTFNEGFIFDGDGALIPARVVEAPWLTKIQPLHEDVPVVLETARGTVRIEGDTVLSTYDIHHADKSFSMEAAKQELPDLPAVQQAGVRYRWDGEETLGMLERSSPLSKIDRG